MGALREVEDLLPSLTRAEMAQGVESTLGVCGGEPRIVRTRIPVWTLDQARRLGVTEQDLLPHTPLYVRKTLPTRGLMFVPTAWKSRTRSAIAKACDGPPG